MGMGRVLVALALMAVVADDDLIGTWKPVTAELAGTKLPETVIAALRLELGKGTYVVKGAESPDSGTFVIDSTKKPKTMDVIGGDGPHKGQTLPCIYEFSGDTLQICYDLSGKKRPAEFKTVKGTLLYLVTYSREK